MNKRMEARRCKDGWLCYITDSHIVKTKGEVLQLAAENNLTVLSAFSSEDKMYAKCTTLRPQYGQLSKPEKEFADYVDTHDTSEMIDSGKLKEVQDVDIQLEEA